METSPEYFRSDVPAGKSGLWTIEKIRMRDRAFDPMSDQRPDCFKFRPGIYTCLSRGRTQFMTDLYDEWWTQRAGIAEAIARGGEILVTGLGLGLVAEAMLRPHASKVTRVTIVESSADVIRLVGPFLQRRYPGRIEIIEADAFSWRPTDHRRFTVGWHDIWPDPYGANNAAEMAGLQAHHHAWCDWQGFWPKAYLEAVAA